jgi:hypothetical protein
VTPPVPMVTNLWSAPNESTANIAVNAAAQTSDLTNLRIS